LGLVDVADEAFRRLADHLREGVAVFAPVDSGTDFVFRGLNAAAERIDGLRSEEVVGRRFTEVFPGVEPFGLLEVFRRVMETGESAHHPITLYKDDRIAGWRENRVFRLPSGEIVTVYEDKTAEKQTEQALRLRDETIESLANGVLISRADGDQEILYVNRAFKQITGYDRRDVLGRNCRFLQGSDRDQPGVHAIRTAVEEGKSTRVRLRNYRKDGSMFWNDLTLSPVYDRDRRLTHFVAIQDDVSAQVEAGRERDEALQCLDVALRSARAGIWDYDIPGERFYGSDLLYSMIGEMPREERMPHAYLVERIHPDDLDGVVAAMETARRGDDAAIYDVEFRLRHSLGHYIWVRSTGKVIERDERGAPRRMIGQHVDITPTKQLEEDLRVREEQYRTLVESVRAVLWEAVPGTFQFAFVSREAERLLGYPAERWTEDPDFWRNHLHPEDREWAVRDCAAATKRGESHRFDYRMIGADGRVVWVRDIVKIVPDGNRPGRLVGIMLDITEEKAHEKRFEALFQCMPIGSVVIDERGAIELVNPAAERMFEYSEDELIGRNVSMLMPEPDRSRHDGYIARYLETGEARIIGTDREVTGLRKSGETFPLWLSVAQVSLGTRRAFVGTVMDLAETKHLEAELLHARKMEAMGHLTGGIAHDFNNLLQVIHGNVEMAAMAIGQGEPAHEELAEIEGAASRATSLVKQLLAFGRRQIMEPVHLDLHETLHGTARMLRRIIGEHITIRIVPATEGLTIFADRGMIGQVIMNLCLNARDAMPDGGTLTLRTDAITVGDATSRFHEDVVPGEYAQLQVSDTGAGMDVDTRARVFEPFFTTKEAGKGTGMGLATVYGIVRQHGGYIEIESEPGAGTTVAVRLPRSEHAPESLSDRDTAEVDLGARGRESILVAEDEPQVRRMAVRILEQAGYTVHEASDGGEAVERVHGGGVEADLLLLDVVMPTMGGREAYRRLVEIGVEAPAIFTTGYDESALHTDFVVDDGITLLKKPYCRTDLLRIVRSVLDARVGQAGIEDSRNL